MVRLTCPRCATTFEPAAGVAPQCPSCGYSPGGAPPAPSAASPPTYAYPGQPPAAQTWAPAPAAGPPVAGTNGMATGALICGILSFCFLPLSIVAIILGVSAKNQIKQTRQQGDGMATAGMTLGIITLAIGLIFLVVWMTILTAVF